MQQHPVPQNVTQYQFRLVGDMTLKQFLELAGGLVGAYLFYSSNLIFIFKWPLAISSILFGFGLAFFPIEDRPLDQWIINFLKSIYTPTRYIWKKSNKVPNVFTFTAHAVIDTVTATKTVKAPPLSEKTLSAASDVTVEEQVRITALDTMLAESSIKNPVAMPAKTEKVTVTKPSITVRKLKPLSSINSTIFESAARPKPNVASPIKISLIDDKVNVPAAAPTEITKEVIVTDKTSTSASTPIFARPSAPAIARPAPTNSAVNIRLPAAPSSPNLIVGMVVDKEGKIVENAIVQIVNQEGVPQRAIKTNSLGQFYTSTPLSKGTYVLEAEKDGFTFAPSKLDVLNQIISPLLIKAS